MRVTAFFFPSLKQDNRNESIAFKTSSYIQRQDIKNKQHKKQTSKAK